MSILLENTEYKKWLGELKAKIRNSQIKAAHKVNSELIFLYWEIGKMIVEKQEKAKWRSGFIKHLAKDLKAEFPNITGFSERNLYSMRQFYLFYSQYTTNLNQLGAELENKSVREETILQVDSFEKFLSIPWRHHVLILKKIKDIDEALFYIEKTIENSWSRAAFTTFKHYNVRTLKH